VRLMYDAIVNEEPRQVIDEPRGISGAELKHPPRALFVDLMKATGVSTLVVFVDELTVVRHVMR